MGSGGATLAVSYLILSLNGRTSWGARRNRQQPFRAPPRGATTGCGNYEQQLLRNRAVPGRVLRRLRRKFPGGLRKWLLRSCPHIYPPCAAPPSLITECISQRASILQFASHAAGGPDPRSGAPLRNNCLDPVDGQKDRTLSPRRSNPTLKTEGARGRVTDAGLS